jgi:hypothetical protein
MKGKVKIMGIRLLAVILLFCLLISSCNLPSGEMRSISWKSQLNAAQEVAKQINPSVVLHYVSAHPINFERPEGKMFISFRFVDSSGKTIVVSFEDTNINKEGMIVGEGTTSLFSKISPLAYEQVLSTVRLSPAEALRQTLSQGQAFAARTKGPVIPNVKLDFHDIAQSAPNNVAVWIIEWKGAEEKQLRIGVDAQTGKVLYEVEK